MQGTFFHAKSSFTGSSSSSNIRVFSNIQFYSLITCIKLQMISCIADDVEDAAAMPESRGVISRLQRQMLALLPHYCITDLQQHQHRLRLAATAASDASTAACTAGNSVDLDDVVAQMEMSIYDILSNIVTLCTSLVTKSGELYFLFCFSLLPLHVPTFGNWNNYHRLWVVKQRPSTSDH